MQLRHTIHGAFGYTVATDPDGSERLVVVGKQSHVFDPTHPGEVPLELAPRDEQRALVEVDQFLGQPGLSAPWCEADYAAYKPRCDVLFVGSAYAPAGRPTTQCEVALRLGSIDKRARVLGPRQWSASLGGVRLTPPVPFERTPLSYAQAFGGEGYAPNPVGVGFASSYSEVDGRAAPSLEALDDPVRSPSATHRPIAYGPMGRGWHPRRPLAGTYDATWREQHAPFLPPDFDYAYFQSAPRDQQLEYPRGGERLTLVNLTASRLTHLRLPDSTMPVEFGRRDGSRQPSEAQLDTIWIDGDAGVLTLCWRSSLPLRGDLSEIDEVLFGPMSPGFYRARQSGKSYFSSLAALVDSMST